MTSTWLHVSPSRHLLRIIVCKFFTFPSSRLNLPPFPPSRLPTTASHQPVAHIPVHRAARLQSALTPCTHLTNPAGRIRDLRHHHQRRRTHCPSRPSRTCAVEMSCKFPPPYLCLGSSSAEIWGLICTSTQAGKVVCGVNDRLESDRAEERRINIVRKPERHYVWCM